MYHCSTAVLPRYTNMIYLHVLPLVFSLTKYILEGSSEVVMGRTGVKGDGGHITLDNI